MADKPLDKGGGIRIEGPAHAVLNSSTVSDNTSYLDGGGIFNGSVLAGNTLTLQNTIIAGNIAVHSGGGGIYADDCAGAIYSLGYNLIGNTAGCLFTPTTGDQSNTDAILGLLEGAPGYHPLLPDSPAINGGNPGGCTGSTGLLSTDQRGFPRFGVCDIGSYEIQPIAFATKKVNYSIVLPFTPVTYTINLSNSDVTDLTSVRVTDTLPIFLTYIDNSLNATSGSYGYENGTISWNGMVTAGESVTIEFWVNVDSTNGPVVNAAVVSGEREIITRTAIVDILKQVYLPLIVKNN